MSIDIEEGKLVFNFDFNAIKFDDSQFYREHFNDGIQKGIKAVDILAVNSNTGYLIEIKDYTHPNTKSVALAKLLDAIVSKVISTLSAILPMKNNASNPTEKNIADLFAKTNEIKVFWHLELPPQRTRLKQSLLSLDNIQMELKKRLKAIDAHPKVVSKADPSRFPWTVN